MIVDMLIAEIAAERGENPKELKDKLVRKIEEEERRVGAPNSQLPANADDKTQRTPGE